MSGSDEVKRELRRELLARLQRGTQRELAGQLGVTQPALSAWMRGRVTFSLEKLLDMWERLGGRVQFVLGREERDEEG